MMWLYVIVLLPVVFGADPTPCCTSTKFTAFLVELGGYLDPGTKTPTPVDQTATIYYDYDNKLLRANRDIPSLQGVERVTVINNYKTMKSYSIVGGNCAVLNLTEPMTANCIPQNASFLGESRIGVNSNSFNINSWHIQTPEFDIKISMTKDRCIPYSQSTFGTVGKVVSEMNYMFTDFKASIPNDIFTIPPECHGNQEHGPPVGRSAMFVV